ncbi:MAG: rhodanese-like domain-containing protein [Propionicimonas sp.]|uniref:rhodanese-like domain-containing protein n=1 Tax=Propionicimonas sp. TaxID=1955623 RepID=UPI002B212EBB|nr:rhodanese-like domain-containing protein [Propionicimonas sp.]MEA4944667.1 rhodanese-like domain-containing protein [Propionicimonas sp.]MEA5053933.1 rhodanese-like domain-containing protein [Propionicimonas sp.]MEA5117858.1 rhodanese-like domain-containing protein [Propionicimonas sp.]
MAETQIPQVDVRTVSENAVILDVREPNEFAAGHTPGAVSIPLGELRDRLAEVPSVDGPLHVICKVGGRSQVAAEFLAEHGIEVVNITGGTGAWYEAGKTLVSETGEAPAVVPPTTPPPPRP